MQCFNVCYCAGVSGRRLITALVCLAALSGQTFAMNAEPPAYEAPHTRIRLFTAGPVGEGVDARPMVGIEIIMEPGWKTYWRTPGDGIAPSFSWDESINLKEARVFWPAPMRFAEADGSSIGYKERLVLPVAITPEEMAKPVSLSLAVAYGICKDICMPVEAELSIDLDRPVRKADRDVLLAALDSVPRQQSEGGLCAHRLLSAKLVLSAAARPALLVEAAHEADAGQRDVLVEAPQEAGLAVPAVEAAGPAGQDAYVFALDPDGVALVKDKPLTFTMLSDRGSCETTSRVE